jgi:hypothetical protein
MEAKGFLESEQEARIRRHRFAAAHLPSDGLGERMLAAWMNFKKELAWAGR